VLPDSPSDPPSSAPPRAPSSTAAQAADILALGRAVLEVIARALRSSPEVRSNRLMARWPLDLEDLLLELRLLQTELPISELAIRLGVSAAQLRSTALRLQRLQLVKVTPSGLSLTAGGRQKLARLEAARGAVLQRIARGIESLDSEDLEMVTTALRELLDNAERVVDEHLGHRRGSKRP
jgi:hypothetical protein